MSAVQKLSESYDYGSRSLEDDRLTRPRMVANPDRKWGRAVDREYVDHHRALIAAMERAQWTEPASGIAFLTDEQILEIRVTYARGELTNDDLAERYGCSATTIGQIVRGDTYASCDGPRTFRGMGNPPPNRQRRETS